MGAGEQGVVWRRLLHGGLLLLAAALFLLHYVHLSADFPNHSQWVDWAKYTDEGWYGDAAIRHYLRGNWRLPGDFNPAVALPVWPLLEGALFRFTGVGIEAARALATTVFGGVMVCSYFMLRVRAGKGADASLHGIFAAAALVLLAASPFVYVFSRMAILEPLLILWVMLALLAADAVRYSRTTRAWVGCAMAVGVLVTLMIGTKTTAIFLLPAVCFMLWDSAGWRWRRVLQVTAVAAGTAALLLGIYFAVLVSKGYLEDFRYLFSANTYTGINRATFLKVIGDTFQDGMWIGSLIYPLSLIAVLFAIFRPRVWRDAVFTSMVLWAAGYMAFMAYHANLQPRYYLVVAVPLVLLLARGAMHLVEWDRLALYALVPLLVILVGHEMNVTLRFVRHPEYSFRTAASRVEHIVESEPGHSHTVLSISGSDLSLMTGLPSICDDFGTMQLEDRIAAYRPGWFVAWNYVEDDKMMALTKYYRLTRVAEFPAMDDPDRNLMIVYRLDPKDGIQPKRKRPGARMLPTGA
jgi:hypothetical protein